MRRGVRAGLATALALAVLAGALPSSAFAPPQITDITDAADAPEQATFVVDPATEVVSVVERRGLTATTLNQTISAANLLGGVAVVNGRGFTMGMRRIVRGATLIRQSQGAGWGYPMSITALPREVIGDLMGRDVAKPVSAGQVVMSQSSATFHGVAVGDQIDLLNSVNAEVRLTIGMIAPDVLVGGSELLMSTATAGGLGATTDTRVMFFGHLDHAAVDTALAQVGLVSTANVRVSRSWDPISPDNTLSLMRTKELLGEFDIYYASLNLATGWVPRSTTWSNANLPAVKTSYPIAAYTVRALCHNAINADLAAALAEVGATYPGLVKSNQSQYFTGIDVANTNNYGGCSTATTARLSRIANGTGTVSRHSWGQAIDMSTTANCQGCVPRLDCNIVRIFRKHNFAWGGNFLEPDGMHFEWVGERRDTIQTAGIRCPNLATNTLAPTSADEPPPTTRSVLFADDGWVLE